jgi:hypothetical protein
LSADAASFEHAANATAAKHATSTMLGRPLPFRARTALSMLRAS